MAASGQKRKLNQVLNRTPLSRSANIVSLKNFGKHQPNADKSDAHKNRESLMDRFGLGNKAYYTQR